VDPFQLTEHEIEQSTSCYDERRQWGPNFSEMTEEPDDCAAVEAIEAEGTVSGSQVVVRGDTEGCRRVAG